MGMSGRTEKLHRLSSLQDRRERSQVSSIDLPAPSTIFFFLHNRSLERLERFSRAYPRSRGEGTPGKAHLLLESLSFRSTLTKENFEKPHHLCIVNS